MSSKKLNNPAASQLAVLKALATLDRPTAEDLASYAQVSRPTVERKLRELREIYSMDIRFQRAGRERGGKGYYLIEAWGLFDPEALQSHTDV